jgi:hypothetical protein
LALACPVVTLTSVTMRTQEKFLPESGKVMIELGSYGSTDRPNPADLSSYPCTFLTTHGSETFVRIAPAR